MSAGASGSDSPAGLERLLAIEYRDEPDGSASARMPVGAEVFQPYGIVHGGAYSVLAETVASEATDRVVRGAGQAAIGQSITVTFLRPVTAGHLNATARTRHRGRTTWVWDVEIADDDGRLCALARMTVAIRPRPGSG